jgi:hypothetical protein
MQRFSALTEIMYISSSAGKEDAGEWLETKMVPKGQRRWIIPLRWRLLGGKGAEEMGWLQRHIWQLV